MWTARCVCGLPLSFLCFFFFSLAQTEFRTGDEWVDAGKVNEAAVELFRSEARSREVAALHKPLSEKRVASSDLVDSDEEEQEVEEAVSKRKSKRKSGKGKEEDDEEEYKESDEEREEEEEEEKEGESLGDDEDDYEQEKAKKQKGKRRGGGGGGGGEVDLEPSERTRPGKGRKDQRRDYSTVPREESLLRIGQAGEVHALVERCFDRVTVDAANEQEAMARLTALPALPEALKDEELSDEEDKVVVPKRKKKAAKKSAKKMTVAEEEDDDGALDDMQFDVQ